MSKAASPHRERHDRLTVDTKALLAALQVADRDGDVAALHRVLTDMVARLADAVRDEVLALLMEVSRADAAEALLHPLLDELQAIGADFGVLGGEKRTDGLRRILTERRDTIAKLNEICARYEEHFSSPGRAIDEIRDALGRRDAPAEKAYRDACASGTGVMRLNADGTVEKIAKEDWRA